MIQPIQPQEMFRNDLPDEVTEAFNELIWSHWRWNGDKTAAEFPVHSVESLILNKLKAAGKEVTLQIVRDQRWTEAYLLFEATGWLVSTFVLTDGLEAVISHTNKATPVEMFKFQLPKQMQGFRRRAFIPSGV